MYTYMDLLPYPMISSVEEIALIAIANRPAGYKWLVCVQGLICMGSGIHCSLVCTGRKVPTIHVNYV